MDKHQLEAEARQVLSACVKELKAVGNLPAGSLIVLGCSTSEVTGANIGKGSVPELGEIIARAMLDACAGEGLRAAFQCCEHLNRCVVMEKETLRDYGCAQVKAIPQPKAGGSVPAAAWKMLREPAWAIRWWACMCARWRCPCGGPIAAWARPTWCRLTAACPTSAAPGPCMRKTDCEKESRYE